MRLRDGMVGEERVEDRLEDFLARDYARLVAALGLICGSRVVAEDAVTEAMVRAWQRLRRGEPIESLPAWVRVVALNEVRSWGRRRRAEAHAQTRLASLRAEPRAEADVGDAAAVWEALGDLPRRQREVTVLRFYLDLDVAAIAAALGISTGSVKTSLSRARAALARVLQPEPIPLDGPCQ